MKAVMIKRMIEKEWQKPCNNASDAYWRASRITELEKRLEIHYLKNIK